MPLPKIIRSRRKTIALIIEADGSLLVRAPLRATNRRIAEIVEEKAAWIHARQAQALARPQPEAHHFVEGEQFWYLGSLYPLHLTVGIRDRLEFKSGQFRLSMGLPTQVVDDREAYYQRKVQVLLTAWYRRQASQVLGQRVTLLAQQCSLGYRQVKITSARTRWGSCSSRGVLSFPWRLVMAPLVVIDYVVVHELVHTVVRGHGRDFWNLVQAFVPEYHQHVAWLKENGRLLEI